GRWVHRLRRRAAGAVGGMRCGDFPARGKSVTLAPTRYALAANSTTLEPSFMESPRFLVVGGPDKDRVLIIQDGGNPMGRHQDVLYKLNDPRASRFHCEVENKDGKVVIRCKGGSGGTIVNGAKVTEHTLKNGDLVQVGESLMRFQTQAGGSAGTTTI